MNLRHTVLLPILRPRALYLSTRAVDPLRILFCGSDDFSIHSLRALHAEKIKDSRNVASIDVVCRPSKPTGRGLKVLREVPVKAAAADLALSVHEVDSFNGWELPTPTGGQINLVVAVSFGLLVPKRILDAARYGGINVHPSMLPDLRGPAPLHHTLLLGRHTTGVTVQTMHPKHFDCGVVLAQTPPPGIDIPSETRTLPRLQHLLAPLAAEMLVDTIRRRLFLQPHVDVGWKPDQAGAAAAPVVTHAPKIRPDDRRVDWLSWPLEKVILRARVLGELWDDSTYGACCAGAAGHKRVIFDNIDVVETSRQYEGLPAGTPFRSQGVDGPDLCVRALDPLKRSIRVKSCTIESHRRSTGVPTLLSMLLKR